MSSVSQDTQLTGLGINANIICNIKTYMKERGWEFVRPTARYEGCNENLRCVNCGGYLETQGENWVNTKSFAP